MTVADNNTKAHVCGLCRQPLAFIDHIIRTLTRWQCENCGKAWAFGWPPRMRAADTIRPREVES